MVYVETNDAVFVPIEVQDSRFSGLHWFRLDGERFLAKVKKQIVPGNGLVGFRHQNSAVWERNYLSAADRAGVNEV
jgi:hypothetical protein